MVSILLGSATAPTPDVRPVPARSAGAAAEDPRSSFFARIRPEFLEEVQSPDLRNVD